MYGKEQADLIARCHATLNDTDLVIKQAELDVEISEDALKKTPEFQAVKEAKQAIRAAHEARELAIQDLKDAIAGNPVQERMFKE